MVKRHWHILCNVPGYLPDNDPEIATTKKEAKSQLRWHRDNYREAGYVVRGRIDDLDYMAYQDPESVYDLGVHIHASECLEEECLDEDDAAV